MSETQKNILIINNGLAGGGIERASITLANYFSELSYKVHVLALYQSKPFFVLSKKIKLTEPSFNKEELGKYLYAIKMIIYIRKSVLKIRPDTILAFGEWTNPYVAFALSGLNYPLFLSDRMSPLAKLPGISEFLRKYFYRKADGIIAQSEFAKSVLIKKSGAVNIHVIHNPVKRIVKLSCPLKKRIVTVGRLEQVKGHEYLVRAFAQLTQKDWELSIVGDGSLRAKLESLTKELGVYNRVIFHGHLNDFRLQLSEAQIFVLPSLNEGFPNALLEAMSLPIACIASDTFFGYPHEIIENGVNGILVKPGDVEELKEAIDNLILNDKLRLQIGANSIEVRDKFEFETIANKYLNLIMQKAL
jgi:GalNAc-alpha-(1->4)-GalNAc-alpha-(1->3)-diNAcBac-PP-undecaprenol alpha-1,4-N-acetyl-D-galactosaminyltransferase